MENSMTPIFCNCDTIVKISLFEICDIEHTTPNLSEGVAKTRVYVFRQGHLHFGHKVNLT